MKLNQKQTDKLMQIAIVFGQKFFYPEPVNNEDIRLVKILLNIRREHVRHIIFRALKVKGK